MKKIAATFLLCILSAPLFAQFDMGLMVGPVMSLNRIESEPDEDLVDPNGASLRISLGVFTDFFLKENYYLSSGLFLAPKNVGIEYRLSGGEVGEESYNIQYLQIPVTLKLYTNEVALDKRIFVQLGLLNEINIDQNEKEGNFQIIQDFNRFDFSLLFRAGLDFRIGYNTAVFGGIGYSRGLTNVINSHAELQELRVKNDVISIDLGIRF